MKASSMNYAQAKRLLRLHSYSLPPDETDARMETGFLGQLRPFTGRLLDENFHELMAALRVVGPTLSSPTVDRDVVSSLWGLLHLSHSWAVDPDGMLQANGLISESDVAKMRRWLDCFGYAVMILLETDNLDEAFSSYDQLADDSTDLIDA